LGTVLQRAPGAATPGTVQVLLPGGRVGILWAAQVEENATRDADLVESVLSVARGFIGMQYLWGGTSAWGLDCSGLVHLSFRSRGVLLPRDAGDQLASGDVEPVDLDAVRPGDLYFFGRPERGITHVGFVSRPVGDDGRRWMLHAPERDGGGRIVEEELDPPRIETLVAAGRVRV
jgi:cell wall-associated NlpC family hydrolase